MWIEYVLKSNPEINDWYLYQVSKIEMPWDVKTIQNVQSSEKIDGGTGYGLGMNKIKNIGELGNRTQDLFNSRF
jgi:Cu2+-containing amine oxidase